MLSAQTEWIQEGPSFQWFKSFAQTWLKSKSSCGGHSLKQNDGYWKIHIIYRDTCQLSVFYSHLCYTLFFFFWRISLMRTSVPIILKYTGTFGNPFSLPLDDMQTPASLSQEIQEPFSLFRPYSLMGFLWWWRHGLPFCSCSFSLELESELSAAGCNDRAAQMIWRWTRKSDDRILAPVGALDF